MSNGFESFDASTMTYTDRNFDALPKGDYIAMITEVTKNQTKSGDDKVDLTFEILDGPFKGRKVWDMLNLWNKSEKATKIAWESLGRICTAIGKQRIKDENDLRDGVLVLSLGVEPKKQDDGRGNKVIVPGEYRNKITGYKPTGEFQNSAPAPSAPAAPNNAKPWQR